MNQAFSMVGAKNAGKFFVEDRFQIGDFGQTARLGFYDTPEKGINDFQQMRFSGRVLPNNDVETGAEKKSFRLKRREIFNFQIVNWRRALPHSLAWRVGWRNLHFFLGNALIQLPPFFCLRFRLHYLPAFDGYWELKDTIHGSRVQPIFQTAVSKGVAFFVAQMSIEKSLHNQCYQT